MKKYGILKKIAIILMIVNMTMITALAEESLLKSGKKPIFERIDREMNLSNLSVSSIVQDKYGFLWFGTQGGLNYFDGRTIQTYKNNPFEKNELVHNLIQTMYYDEDNHEMWIGTYQGLSHFIISDCTFENYSVEANGLSNAVVVAIEKDSSGNIWVGTLDGLNKLNPETDENTIYEVPGDAVRALLIDSEGRLLIGSYEGLLYYDEGTDEIAKVEVDIPTPFVMQVKEFEKGIITLGLWDGGIVEMNIDGKVLDSSTYDDNRVYCISKTNDGTLWVGTWGGGLFAKTKEGDVFHFEGDGGENSLAHPIVYSLLQDETENLWIGTNGGGISKINPRKHNYVRYSHNPKVIESLSKGKINSIFRDSLGNLWVAIYGSGLNRLDEENNKFIKYGEEMDEPFHIKNNQVIEIFETRENELIFGTGDGIQRYNYETGIIEGIDVLPEGTLVYALEEDLNQNLFIGTYSKGLYIYDKTTDSLKNYNSGNEEQNHISDNLVYDILVDSKGRTWVGTNNGLNMMKPGQEKFKEYRRSLGDYDQIASNTIRCMYEDSKGRIWVGTVSGGISLYNEDDDTFTSYTEYNGMPDNTIMSINEGKDGYIWMATQNGIAVLNPEDGDIFRLTPEDGIGFWEFNSGIFAEKDGTLLFGGIDGITAIPSNVEINDYKPPHIYITNVSVRQEELDNSKQIFNGEEIILSPDENLIEFEFVALDYDSPDKVKFLYKLEGFEDDWNKADTRNYASYSNLSPGKYEFIVTAETYRGIGTESANLFFTIEKPWYKTIYAYVLFALIILGVILAAYKIREGYLINAKNSELSILNKRLEETNSELEKASIKDHLTGMYNRGYFDVLIREQMDFAKRSKADLSLIMFDVDNFKDINDTFGHLSGDDFLIRISKAISSVLPRSTDTVTRFGGDEFAVVLYDTDKKGAIIVAERIIKAFDEVSSMRKFTDGKIKTTLSIGIVSARPSEKTEPEDLLEAADKALYEAKQQGKNRICISNEIL